MADEIKEGGLEVARNKLFKALIGTNVLAPSKDVLETLPDLSYKPVEFFYDQSFNDYDLYQDQQIKNRVRTTMQHIGQIVLFRLYELNMTLDIFAEGINKSLSFVTDLTEGRLEDLDLRSICAIESFLEIEIVSVVED